MPSAQLSAMIRSFLERPLNAIFASIRSDGQPVLAPVWFVWEDGAFVVSTSTATRRWAHLKRDRRCSILVDGEAGYVGAMGTAELRTRGIRTMTRRIVEKYVESERVEAYLKELYAGTPRTIVLLRPDRIYSWGIDT